MHHIDIIVPADVEVEIVRDDCPCAAGTICAPDDAFAGGCPRLAALDRRFLLLRGAAARPLYLARLCPADDADAWTEERDDARRFDSLGRAEAMRADLLVRQGYAIAIVPA